MQPCSHFSCAAYNFSVQSLALGGNTTLYRSWTGLCCIAANIAKASIAKKDLNLYFNPGWFIANLSLIESQPMNMQRCMIREEWIQHGLEHVSLCGVNSHYCGVNSTQQKRLKSLLVRWLPKLICPHHLLLQDCTRMHLRVIHQVFIAIKGIDEENLNELRATQLLYDPDTSCHRMVWGTSIFTICHGMGKRKYTKQIGSLDNKAATCALDSQKTHWIAVCA